MADLAGVSMAVGYSFAHHVLASVFNFGLNHVLGNSLLIGIDHWS